MGPDPDFSPHLDHRAVSLAGPAVTMMLCPPSNRAQRPGCSLCCPLTPCPARADITRPQQCYCPASLCRSEFSLHRDSQHHQLIPPPPGQDRPAPVSLGSGTSSLGRDDLVDIHGLMGPLQGRPDACTLSPSAVDPLKAGYLGLSPQARHRLGICPCSPCPSGSEEALLHDRHSRRSQQWRRPSGRAGAAPS